MAAALSTIRVLDLTNVLAGPYCAYQLALLGADVIKVEVPDGGDLARQLGADAELNAAQMGASFLAQNAGKRSITLNLKREEGREVLKKLVAISDVVVENFRPGVMKRLGLGYDTLADLNPGLVYAAISGFGQEGPMKASPAYDQIIQGLSGMMSITGSPASAPLRVGYPVADTLAGVTAAFAISSALVRRLTTGEGAFIDVSMLDSALSAMGWVVSNYLICGVQPAAHGNDNFTASPSGAFRARDGLINIAANKQEQFETLAKAIGRPDLVEDERFAGREARKRHRAALTAELETALAARPCAEWEVLFNALGVPAGCVLTVPQALALQQVEQRAFQKRLDDVPGAGRPVTVTRSGFRFATDTPDVALPPPALGAHTDEVLRLVGYDDAAIARLRESAVV